MKPDDWGAAVAILFVTGVVVLAFIGLWHVMKALFTKKND